MNGREKAQERMCQRGREKREIIMEEKRERG